MPSIDVTLAMIRLTIPLQDGQAAPKESEDILVTRMAMGVDVLARLHQQIQQVLVGLRERSSRSRKRRMGREPGKDGGMKKIFVGLVFLILMFGMSVLTPFQGHSEQMEPTGFSRGVEYALLMSRDDQVCKHMLTLFNQDLAKFEIEKYNEHEEFRSIGWKKETIARMEGDREVTDFVEAAHVDIDNDGIRDLVFRRTDFLHGYEVHWLNIFQGLSPGEKLWSRTEIVRSPGRISPGGYLLTPSSSGTKKSKLVKIPSMASISRLEPFQFNGTTYVGMRPLYELVTGSDPVTEFSKIFIITKYREGKYGGGPDPNEKETGKRDDICYLKVRTMPYIP